MKKFWENYIAFDWGEIIHRYLLERIGGKVESMYIDVCNN